MDVTDQVKTVDARNLFATEDGLLGRRAFLENNFLAFVLKNFGRQLLSVHVVA